MTELSREARDLIAKARPAERADDSAKQRVRAALAAHVGPPLPAPLPPAAAGAGALGAGLSASKLVLICSLAVAGVAGTTALVKTRHAPQPVVAARHEERLASPALAPSAGQPQEAVSAAAAPVPAMIPPVLPTPVRRVPGRVPAGRTGEPVREPAAVLSPMPKPEAFAALVPEAPPSREPPLDVASPTSSWRSSNLPEPVTDREAARPVATIASKGCSAERELGLLSRAQAALRARSGQRALDLLAEHAALCPSATFWQERSAARVLALCLLQREPQALAEAARLRSLAPRSPLLARLRTSCAGAAVEP